MFPTIPADGCTAVHDTVLTSLVLSMIWVYVTMSSATVNMLNNGSLKQSRLEFLFKYILIGPPGIITLTLFNKIL